jgi:large subunit ribosomal protein L47
MMEYKSSNVDQVKLTQRAIKHVLTERWYAWEDARLLAESDASVNLYPAEGETAYTPEKVEFMVRYATHQHM